MALRSPAKARCHAFKRTSGGASVHKMQGGVEPAASRVTHG